MGPVALGLAIVAAIVAAPFISRRIFPQAKQPVTARQPRPEASPRVHRAPAQPSSEPSVPFGFTNGIIVTSPGPESEET
jgi:hypothetical protein